MVRLKRIILPQSGLIFLIAVLSALVLFILPARPQDPDRSSIYPGDSACASDNSPDRDPRKLQLDLRGLVSAWGVFSRADSSLAQLGTRFLPEFTLELNLKRPTAATLRQQVSRHSSAILTTPHLPFSANRPAASISIPENSNFLATELISAQSSFPAVFLTDQPLSPISMLSQLISAPGPSFFDNSSVPSGTTSAAPAAPFASSNEVPLTFYPLESTPSSGPSSASSPAVLSAEFSLNLWGTLTIQPGSENQFNGRLKPYRLSVKYATPRFEARLGLQKISFGSASLLRPLMWFDRLDPRDPLQLTDGVYGLLVRTYISTRTNLWAWALYGNDDPKGWEALPTRRRCPEFGLRAQLPLGPGELAFTAHRRRVDFNLAMAPGNPALELIPLKQSSPLAFTFPETRFAVDGKWDLGPGLWFEAVLADQRSPYLAFPWQRALTIGLDYTFALGNGLHLLGEYFQSDIASGALSGITYAPFRARFLAASASYPLSFIDQLAAIFFYDTRNRDLYSFVRWQRNYDRWAIHLMAFWNPAQFRIFAAPDQLNLFAGKGLQILIVYTF